MCFCSCWFHFSPHYYFPLLPLSFPILVPFLLLFFDFLPNSPCSCGVCPSHPFSVPSVCLNCASSFTVCCWRPLGAQSRGLPAPLGVPRALPQGRCSTAAPAQCPPCPCAPALMSLGALVFAMQGQRKRSCSCCCPSGRHTAPPQPGQPFPSWAVPVRSTRSRGQPRTAQQCHGHPGSAAQTGSGPQSRC